MTKWHAHVVHMTKHQRRTRAGVSEWTPAGVLTIFKNRSGAGVGFSKEWPEPEWSRSQFFNKRLVCLLLIIVIADCFLQKCYKITFKFAKLLHRKS